MMETFWSTEPKTRQGTGSGDALRVSWPGLETLDASSDEAPKVQAFTAPPTTSKKFLLFMPDNNTPAWSLKAPITIYTGPAWQGYCNDTI